MKRLTDIVVLVRGGGEVASGVAYRLHMAGLRVCITEIGSSLAVTRGTTFSEAVFDGAKTIMDVTARLVPGEPQDISREHLVGIWQNGEIPVVVDPKASIKETLRPDVLVDAIMAKRNIGTAMSDAPLVIGVGPGFCAGRDVHVVVESNHSADLGRVIFEGEAERNTGIPVDIGGLTRERVVWVAEPGTFTTELSIGDTVSAGQVVGWVDNTPVKAPLAGILRGLLRSGVRVPEGAKLLEVDHIHDRSVCEIMSRKVLTIGDGVLSAIKTILKASPI